MEEAQERMFNVLLSYFPPPPAEVLDVGCGLGLSASLLSEKGYRVTAIAPSEDMINYAKNRYGKSGAEFMALGFLDEEEGVFSPGRYDVLFFQESAQNLGSMDDVVKKTRWLLKENGLLIIGDEVCYDRSIKTETAVHMAGDFVTALSENGFRIVEHDRIGNKVVPTCDFIIGGFAEHFDDIVSTSGGQNTRERLSHYLAGWKKQKQWYSTGQMGYEILVGKRDGYFIRPYTPGDEKKILPMFNEVFNVNRTIEHWYWKFRNDPFGAHKISEVFSEDGRLVAHYAGYPVPFYSLLESPETFVSYQIGDTMTRPSVRNIGLGKTGLLARVANHFYAKFCEGIPFIYGFNTGNHKKLGIRYLGYTYISPVTFWVKNLGDNPLKSPSSLRRFFPGFAVDEVLSVNEEWDVFFRKVRTSYRFLVQRDAAYLRWRYLDCPDKVHRIFSVRKRGRLAGWGVFTCKGKRLIWGDALFDSSDIEPVGYLLRDVTKNYFPEAETIEGWFSRRPEWWSRLLEKTGFSIIPEPNDLAPCFVIFGDEKMKDKLEGHLYYTWGDSDLF